jgi:hypothetical protein
MFTPEDVQLLATARRDGFDRWYLLTDLAAKIALALPRTAFRKLFVEHTRVMLDRGEHGMLADFLEGLVHHSGDQGVPLAPAALTDILESDWGPTREAGLLLLPRLAGRKRRQR